MQYYTASQILEEFEKNPLKQKLNILDSAVDYMQQWNGRTKIKCIALAMGYDNTEGNHDTYFKVQ